jgi:putative phosphoesterase
MKILCISDIHGSLPALKASIDAFHREQCSQIVILGDLMYHGPRNPLPDGYNPAEVASLINTFKDRIIAVRGNCDSEVDQMLVEYPMMETYAQISDSALNIFLTHGHVFGPDRRPPLPEGSILAFGHTHIPVAEKSGSIWLFNPGSVSLPKKGYAASYGIYDGRSLYVKALNGDSILKADL